MNNRTPSPSFVTSNEQASRDVIRAAIALDREWRDRNAGSSDYNWFFFRKAESDLRDAVRRYELATGPEVASNGGSDVPGQLYLDELFNPNKS